MSRQKTFPEKGCPRRFRTQTKRTEFDLGLYSVESLPYILRPHFEVPSSGVLDGPRPHWTRPSWDKWDGTGRKTAENLGRVFVSKDVKGVSEDQGLTRGRVWDTLPGERTVSPTTNRQTISSGRRLRLVVGR